MGADPYRYYRIESRELIDQLTRAALDLERAPQPAPLVDTLLRLAHTLKGAARVVKQHDTAEHAHAVEDVLVPLRGATHPLDRQELEALFARLDAIRDGVVALERPISATPTEVSSESAAPAAPSAGGEPQSPMARVNTDEIERLREHLSETHAAVDSVERQQVALEQARHLAGRVRDAVRRLDLKDRELQSAAEGLSNLVASSQRALDGVAHRLRSDLAEARESAARLQFIAADSLFVTLEVTARDAAKLAAKEVQVSCEGGDIRLAADVVGVIQGAMIQAVRNAVAHGLEVPEERLVCGKQAQGQIKIAVRRDGARIAFSCSDDGVGVNLGELRRMLAAPTDAEKPPDKEELLRRLLVGNISTSGQVTQLAGRGLGLGILREAATRLRGELVLRSEPGRGTEIELKVPLSSAMLDALIVAQNGHAIAIPLHAVKHALRVDSRDLVTSARGQSVVFGADVLPYASMGHAIRQAAVDLTRYEAWSAVVVEAANGSAAIGVEHIRGIQNIIVKPLPAHAPADAVVMAAYLDPDGKPQVVVNPEGLIELCKTSIQAPANDPVVQLPVLVIDDSLTTRMLEQGILESAGYEVELAVSGEDGLARARATPHALFLVDVEMPGISGFEFIEQVRADAALRDTPALLVTSLGSAAHRARGMRAGADGYIDKGQFEQQEFLAMVRRMMHRR